MDNSPIFHLNKGTTLSGGEETSVSLSERSNTLQSLFGATPLPGSASFTASVEGVPLVRDMEGSFSYRSGLNPQHRGDDDAAVAFFHDRDRDAPGVIAGNGDLFFAASWANRDSFFGYDEYEAESFNAAAGNGSLYLRFSDKKGRKRAAGVVGAVEGRSVGVTVSHAVETRFGMLTPFLHSDRFEGGRADTPFGAMKLARSAWHHEAGLALERGPLSLAARAMRNGDSGSQDHAFTVGWRSRF